MEPPLALIVRFVIRGLALHEEDLTVFWFFLHDSGDAHRS